MLTKQTMVWTLGDDWGNSDQRSGDINIDADESEYFPDMNGSDSPEEDQTESPPMREEDKMPRLSTKEVDILQEHLEEWSGLKGEKDDQSPFGSDSR